MIIVYSYCMLGPGKWELQAHKKERSAKCKVTSTLKAIPTATHMAFVKLHQVGTKEIIAPITISIIIIGGYSEVCHQSKY